MPTFEAETSFCTPRVSHVANAHFCFVLARFGTVPFGSALFCSFQMELRLCLLLKGSTFTLVCFKYSINLDIEYDMTHCRDNNNCQIEIN